MDGTIVGTKQRQQINKQIDLYHTVFTMLKTPDNKLVLSKIPDRKDLPNLYPGKLGATAVTIRRHDEAADIASIRAVKNELLIEDTKPAHLGNSYLVLSDGRKKYMSVFLATHETPMDFSRQDIESLATFSNADLDQAIESDESQFTLTFLAIWNKYRENLFVA